MDQDIRDVESGRLGLESDVEEVRLDERHPAEQLCDVVARELALVALEKGRGGPVGLVEDALEGVIPRFEPVGEVRTQRVPGQIARAGEGCERGRVRVEAVAVDREVVAAIRGPLGHVSGDLAKAPLAHREDVGPPVDPGAGGLESAIYRATVEVDAGVRPAFPESPQEWSSNDEVAELGRAQYGDTGGHAKLFASVSQPGGLATHASASETVPPDSTSTS